MNHKKTDTILILIIALCVVFHGSLIPYTFTKTYDALIHLFFAAHYSRDWFEHWNYQWYTGFHVITYPPGAHQSVALLSKIIPIKSAYVIIQTIAIAIFILGIYKYSRIWANKKAALWACFITIFMGSINETIHVFGQLPTIFSLGLFLNSLCYIYQWIVIGKLNNLIKAIILTGGATAVHHVTPLFGGVFFIGPILLKTILMGKNPISSYLSGEIKFFTVSKVLIFDRMPRLIRAAELGFLQIIVMVTTVLPYWIISKKEPITQVAIPHGSRDNFLQEINSGFIFLIVPWGILLFILPYVFLRMLNRKHIPIFMTFSLLFILGLGGTTPIAKTLLRGAFDILTLDRFTFWASITCTPILGLFVQSLLNGSLRKKCVNLLGSRSANALTLMLLIGHIGWCIFTVNLTSFKKIQPDPIDFKPIANFMAKDNHFKWRYLMLGVGDQMAWITSQIPFAYTVDGNYHSARRLPELTSTPIERLEGAKFKGVDGIGALQRFLTTPEKYNLKYILSNDKFYEPVLYFSGWSNIGRLENHLTIWQKEDIPKIPARLGRKDIPVYQRIMWGTVPITYVIITFFILLFDFRRNNNLLKLYDKYLNKISINRFLFRFFSQKPLKRTNNNAKKSIKIFSVQKYFRSRLTKTKYYQFATIIFFNAAIYTIIFLFTIAFAKKVFHTPKSPQEVTLSFYDAIDFRDYKRAYTLFNPDRNMSLEDFKQTISSRNGLTDSYAKMESLIPNVLFLSDKKATIEAQIKYVTSIYNYDQKVKVELINKNGKWYIDNSFKEYKNSTRGLIKSNTKISWLGLTTPSENLNDIERMSIRGSRPKISIKQINLTSSTNKFFVTGLVANESSLPLFLTTSTFLDYLNEPQIFNNAQIMQKHFLMPKESTFFRIDFDPVAGFNLTTLNDLSDYFFKRYINSPIDKFTANVKSTFSLFTKFKNLDHKISKFNNDRTINIEISNNTNNEAAIPQVSFSLFDENKNIIFVGQQFVNHAISQSGTKTITLKIPNRDDFELHNKALDDLIVNGTKVKFHKKDPINLIKLPNEFQWKYIKIQTNFYNEG